MTFAEAYKQLTRMHAGHLTQTELSLLALAAVDGLPLRAGSDVVDAARLVRARRLVEAGASGRDALAEARQSEGLHNATLDDCLRLKPLFEMYVQPYGEFIDNGPTWPTINGKPSLSDFLNPNGREAA